MEYGTNYTEQAVRDMLDSMEIKLYRYQEIYLQRLLKEIQAHSTINRSFSEEKEMQESECLNEYLASFNIKREVVL